MKLTAHLNVFVKTKDHCVHFKNSHFMAILTGWTKWTYSLFKNEFMQVSI